MLRRHQKAMLKLGALEVRKKKVLSKYDMVCNEMHALMRLVETYEREPNWKRAMRVQGFHEDEGPSTSTLAPRSRDEYRRRCEDDTPQPSTSRTTTLTFRSRDDDQRDTGTALTFRSRDEEERLYITTTSRRNDDQRPLAVATALRRSSYASSDEEEEDDNFRAEMSNEFRRDYNEEHPMPQFEENARHVPHSRDEIQRRGDGDRQSPSFRSRDDDGFAARSTPEPYNGERHPPGEERPSITTMQAAAVTTNADCVICYDRRREVIMLPCGHLFSCRQCVNTGIERARQEHRLFRCYVCNGLVSFVNQAYM